MSPYFVMMEAGWISTIRRSMLSVERVESFFEATPRRTSDNRFIASP